MNVHFIAIGGSVMHNLALSLREKGYKVTGSDDEIFEPAKSLLLQHGLLPEKFGWFPEKIHSGLDAVILGMHARIDNPELVRAQALGLKIYSFPSFVAQQIKDKKRVVIGGSHGKTTITSMIMHVLKYLNKDFDYLVGSRIEGFDLMVKLTDTAPIVVIEGDEYLSSATERVPKFHLYEPHIGLITGIAWDHINVFPTFDNYAAQFALFVETFEKNGVLVYNLEDPLLRQIALYSPSNLVKMPYDTPAYRIADGVTFLIHNGKEYPIMVFGRHNLQNLEGARNVCNALGIKDAAFFEAIASFTGASKRLETMAKGAISTLFRDFAHSPSKLKATTEAVKEQYPDRKLVAVMELHTYSSLNKNFLKEYAGAMDAADTAIVYYSSHAMEIKKMPPLDEQLVIKSFNRPDLVIINQPQVLKDLIFDMDYANTNLLMMSSGSFDGLDWAALGEKVTGKANQQK